MQRIIVLVLLVTGISGYSQELAQIHFSGGSSLKWFSLLTDREVLIRISPDGHILEWGIEVQSIRSSQYYAPRLQPYPGRIEYYGPEADSVSRGKIKSIGSSVITYFQVYEMADKVGKIRSIGRQFFDYYSQYDNQALRGKISTIGAARMDYYSNFDDAMLSGKLKSVGNTAMAYYTSFDDKMIRGKIKSIGPVNYQWYTSYDPQGYGGNLKSGPFRQLIGSVIYVIQ